TIFTWQNGNMTKMTQTSLITGLSLEYHYDYFTDKPVKAMPFFYVQAQEILMYQSAVNFGNPVKNLPKSMKLYITPANVYTYNFYRYVIDDNDYVQTMRLSQGDYNNSSGIKFNFQYKCF
ncbi:MAG TPA: hypothetical protein VEZ17_12360, partial [Chitinophagaceae bacterium]|nr:hypothetical protein [Chitinophagaceae bacterium]